MIVNPWRVWPEATVPFEFENAISKLQFNILILNFNESLHVYVQVFPELLSSYKYFQIPPLPTTYAASTTQNIIMEAISMIQENTCIRFVPRNTLSSDEQRDSQFVRFTQTYRRFVEYKLTLKHMQYV